MTRKDWACKQADLHPQSHMSSKQDSRGRIIYQQTHNTMTEVGLRSYVLVYHIFLASTRQEHLLLGRQSLYLRIAHSAQSADQSSNRRLTSTAGSNEEGLA